jgi:branched-chain amino acid aminotransferase
MSLARSAGGRVAVRAMISRVGYTPAPLLQRGPAQGISRRSVIELAGEAGHLVEQGRLSADDLRRAAEVLVTFTASGIMPVTVIDGEPVGTSAPGPPTTQLRDRCWGRHEDPLSSAPVCYDEQV